MHASPGHDGGIAMLMKPAPPIQRSRGKWQSQTPIKRYRNHPFLTNEVTELEAVTPTSTTSSPYLCLLCGGGAADHPHVLASPRVKQMYLKAHNKRVSEQHSLKSGRVSESALHVTVLRNLPRKTLSSPLHQKFPDISTITHKKRAARKVTIASRGIATRKYTNLIPHRRHGILGVAQATHQNAIKRTKSTQKETADTFRRTAHRNNIPGIQLPSSSESKETPESPHKPNALQLALTSRAATAALLQDIAKQRVEDAGRRAAANIRLRIRGLAQSAGMLNSHNDTSDVQEESSGGGGLNGQMLKFVSRMKRVRNTIRNAKGFNSRQLFFQQHRVVTVFNEDRPQKGLMWNALDIANVLHTRIDILESIAGERGFVSASVYDENQVRYRDTYVNQEGLLRITIRMCNQKSIELHDWCMTPQKQQVQWRIGDQFIQPGLDDVAMRAFEALMSSVKSTDGWREHHNHNGITVFAPAFVKEVQSKRLVQVKATMTVPFSLEIVLARIQNVSQWPNWDPSFHSVVHKGKAFPGKGAPLSLYKVEVSPIGTQIGTYYTSALKSLVPSRLHHPFNSRVFKYQVMEPGVGCAVLLHSLPSSATDDEERSCTLGSNGYVVYAARKENEQSVKLNATHICQVFLCDFGRVKHGVGGGGGNNTSLKNGQNSSTLPSFFKSHIMDTRLLSLEKLRQVLLQDTIGQLPRNKQNVTNLCAINQDKPTLDLDSK